MLSSIRLVNFKGHRDSEIALEPFTVFVGPNASGKTSVLEALGLLQRVLVTPAHRKFPPAHGEFTDLVRSGESSLRVEVAAREKNSHGAVALHAEGTDEFSTWVDVQGDSEAGEYKAAFSDTNESLWERAHEMAPASAIVTSLLKLSVDPAAVSAPSKLASTRPRVAPNGGDVAAVLATAKLTAPETFQKIVDTLRKIVPVVEDLRIVPANVGPDVGFDVEFEFRGGARLPSRLASAGTLVTLAIVTAIHAPERPRLLLLDEIDHALHPRAQLELVRRLRALVAAESSLQVIATTHSPCVLDAVEAREVRVFASRADGTVAVRPLTAHPQAARVNGALSPGELWTLDDGQTWVK